MTDDNINTNNVEESIRLANEWCGKIVEISGRGGYVTWNNDTNENNSNSSNDTASSTKQIRTSYSSRTNCRRFEIIKVDDDIASSSSSSSSLSVGIVAFRLVQDSNNNDASYLQQVMYGDDARNALTEILNPWKAVQNDVKPLILDYIVDKASDCTNFEGPGANYTPMIATAYPSSNNKNGKLSTLQYFYIEPTIGNQYEPHKYHIRSYYGGSYWRSQHWTNTISQTNNRDEDEMWTFTAIEL